MDAINKHAHVLMGIFVRNNKQNFLTRQYEMAIVVDVVAEDNLTLRK